MNNTPPLSDRLMRLWVTICAEDIGVQLPLNYISYDEEENTGDIGYAAGENDPPIDMADGTKARIFTMKYTLEDIKNDQFNVN